MRLFLIFILTISVCSSAISMLIESEKDSLVRLSDIQFDSPFEEEQFLELLNGGSNIFEAFMVVNNPASGQAILNEKQKYLAEVNEIQRKLKNKNKSKYYAAVYKEIHARFLKKYEERNYFHHVFSSGLYNCVSATALHAIMFDALDVPYLIKEIPTHVYLEVDPDGDPLILETTDPSGGFDQFRHTEDFMASFIYRLKQEEKVSVSDLESEGLDNLFDRFYYKFSNVVSLKELVGVQYWNDGIYQSQAGNHEKAMHAFQKSYLLYPNENLVEVLHLAIENQVYGSSFNKFEDSNLLIFLSRFDLDEKEELRVIALFNSINYSLLIEKTNLVLFDSCYQNIISRIENDFIEKEIKYDYNYARARKLMEERGDSREAFEFVNLALEIKPFNAHAQSLYLANLVRFEFEDNKEHYYSEVDESALKHPHLFENTFFGNVYLDSHLSRMREYYSAYKIEEGNIHRKIFEKTMSKSTLYEPNHFLIGKAYSPLAVYFFKKGNYSSAQKTLEKGLYYAPENHELLSRKRAIEN